MSRIITLFYRKLINDTCSNEWERAVFESSWMELKMQAQFYNPVKKYETYESLIKNNPAAVKLPFLVSASVIGYIHQLNGIIPDVPDNLGNPFLKFTNFQFEILQSNFGHSAGHKVVVSFYSDPIEWRDSIGEYMILSAGMDKNGGEQLHTFQLRPFVGIHSLLNKNYEQSFTR